MSLDATHWAWKQKGLNMAQKLIVGVPDRHKDVPEKEQFQNRNSSKSGMDSSTKNGIQNLSRNLPEEKYSSCAHTCT
jgi:hypothetical protein